jgi:hypothetical protein
LSLFGPNILLSTLFSNIPSLCSSLIARDQVSHPYRTTSKIIVLYILIFKFFDRSKKEICRYNDEQLQSASSRNVWTKYTSVAGHYPTECLFVVCVMPADMVCVDLCGPYPPRQACTIHF